MIKKFKNKTSILFGILLIIIISIIFTGCNKETASDRFNIYKEKWESKDYEGMYEMLSTESKEYISKEDFLDRYNNIYKGIGAKNISIEVDENKEEDIISFSINMDTVAGNVDIPDYKLTMVPEEIDDENVWAVDWDESLIFPEMTLEDKVRVDTIESTRGEIYDRNGEGLAVNGTLINVGIHPKEFEEGNVGSKIKQMTKILDIEASIIQDKLDQNTNPDYFVPIVKLSYDDNEKLSKVMGIEGVTQKEVKGRVYPGGEAFGALIGYINPITAEELEELEEDGYTSQSMVGKLGLESVFEDRLKAQDGKVIYISKINNGQEIEQITIGKTEAKDGENVQLTIDKELQEKMYKEMDKDVGAATALDPKSGEVLALVSSPSFDSNLYSTYITNSQKAEWDNSDVNVFNNRFNSVYSPGSTFKLITGAIGLEKGVIKPNKKMNIEGKQWQPDSSWGKYKITRVNDKINQVNLTDAFVYSDNIYFARTALNIGAKDFIKEAKKFGLGEKLSFSYPIAKSQVANDEKIDKDTLLANTGYGQGEVLMSPLHVSLVYSSLVNDGNIVNPLLEMKEGNSPTLWKENVIEKENIDILLNSLIEVIENEKGTGNDAKISGIKLAGKTGTAELKKSLEDEDGEENGWFVAMDTENPDIVISMMIENVRNRGGSHHVVPKVRNILDYYLNI
ncbi:penicillin-binding transpeptidase domain-containing protein [Clostridium sp. D2Q-14]|uniref:penicillin-binding transpeptidase domain-containing protein n=1 Tax=Anaeromonas gelatinilytica TaxID=2683194 RepID=UPI00193B2F6E|nr:penicillin-binding transpeptidase domain-containing protein [Anaeromonas gelatinilytica]MBS4534497.1 penicillin-binding transpeptidase domain-containing protein [Anaeromonas gelatinilytica]